MIVYSYEKNPDSGSYGRKVHTIEANGRFYTAEEIAEALDEKESYDELCRTARCVDPGFWTALNLRWFFEELGALGDAERRRQVSWDQPISVLIGDDVHWVSSVQAFGGQIWVTVNSTAYMALPAAA